MSSRQSTAGQKNGRHTQRPPPRPPRPFGKEQGQQTTPDCKWLLTCTQQPCSTCDHLRLGCFRPLTPFLPEVREFIRDTRPTNKHDTGWAEGAPSEDYTTPPSARNASSGRIVGGAPAGTRPLRGWLIPRVPCSGLVPQGDQTAVLPAHSCEGDVRENVLEPRCGFFVDGARLPRARRRTHAGDPAGAAAVASGGRRRGRSGRSRFASCSAVGSAACRCGGSERRL